MFLPGDSRLKTTSVFLAGALALAESYTHEDGVPMSADEIALLSEFILDSKHVGDIEGLYDSLRALRAVSSTSTEVVAEPIAITTTRKVSDSAAGPTGGSVEITVTDVFGRFVAECEVTVKAFRGEHILVEDSGPLPLREGSRSSYAFDIVRFGPEAGLYDLDVRVTPKGEDAPIVVPRVVMVTTRMALDDALLWVDADEAARFPTKAAKRAVAGWGDALVREGRPPLAAAVGQVLHASFEARSATTGAALYPHQAFLRLRSVESGLDTYFVATPAGAGRGSTRGGGDDDLAEEPDDGAHRDAAHVAACPLDDHDAWLSGPGVHEATLIIGDPTLEGAVEWSLGLVDLELQARTEEEHPLYTRSLLHHTDTTLKPLPEISHRFRKMETGGLSVATLVFLGLTMAPFAVLFEGVRRVGPGFTSLKDSSMSDVMGFHGGLLVCFVILFLNWIFMTIYDTLRVLSAVLVVVCFFGHRLLMDLARRDMVARSPRGKKRSFFKRD
jgi:hypothetical protein